MFAESTANRLTDAATFIFRSYTNFVLPAPIVFENFDAVAEGGEPVGWIRTSYSTASAEHPGEDVNDPESDAYLGRSRFCAAPSLSPLGIPIAPSGLFVGQSTVDQATADGIVAGQTYFNIHTAANPGGEIRGQVLIAP